MEDCDTFDQFGEFIPREIFAHVGSSILVSIFYLWGMGLEHPLDFLANVS
jgi:hypothetical protein